MYIHPESLTPAKHTGMANVLFCTVVYGSYEHFIPPYVFSTLYNYPQSWVKILYRDRLSAPVRESLDVVRSISARFEVIEEWMSDLHGDLSAARWLLGRKYFAGFDYAWIGDIDFLHLCEDPTLLEQQVDRARTIGKPYSNVCRVTPDSFSRMSGLHFIIVKPYFDQMDSVITEAWSDERIIGPDGVMQWNSQSRPNCVTFRNEWVLYELIRRGCGVLDWNEPRPFAHSLRHGIHLGLHAPGNTAREYLRSKPGLSAAVLSLTGDERFEEVMRPLASIVRIQVSRARQFFAGI